MAERILAPMERYHRLEVRGLERLPEGPALLVANHSSGPALTDALFLLPVYRHLGFEEPIHVLAHDFLFATPGFGQILPRLGALRAHPNNARRILDAGRKLLVFPGSDHDSMRPFRDRHKVFFAGHKGFARIALERRAPIVPVAIAGAHETFVVLSQGKKMASRLGLPRRMRWSSLPITLNVPWGVSIGFWSYVPYLPLPAKVTVEIGEPLDPLVATEGSGGSPVSALYHATVIALERLLGKLYAERRFPILG